MYKFQCFDCGYSFLVEHMIEKCPNCNSQSIGINDISIGDNHPHFVKELEDIVKKHNEVKSSNKLKEPKISKKDIQNFKEKLKGIETLEDIQGEWK